MRNRLKTVLRPAVIVLAVTGVGQVARGDVVAGGRRASGQPTVFRFTDAGQTGPMTAASSGESYDAVAVGPDGNYYAASNSLGLGTVVVYSGVTNAIVKTFPQPQSQAAVRYAIPWGLAFGPDGSLYASSNRFVNYPTSVAGVLRFDVATGAIAGTPIDFGAETSQFAVGDVAVRRDGRAFVSTSFGIVTEAAPDEAEFVAGRTFIRRDAGGLNVGGSLAFGPDGNLYVGGGNRVLRFDGTTGALLGTLMTPSAGPIYDIAFDTAGDLLIANGTASLYRFNGVTGAPLGTLATVPGASLTNVAVGMVPEPSAVALVACGAVALRRRRVAAPIGMRHPKRY